MREEKVLIPSSAIRLEGLLSNQEALHLKGGVILCHPHPQYGGDMYNPVIAIAVEAASQEGFATLRFNFRGVGESEGSYGEGIGEREDVKAVIEYLRGPPTGSPQMESVPFLLSSYLQEQKDDLMRLSG